jgi:hypothetical protein
MSKNTNLSFLTDYITADITNGRIGINNASPTVAFDVTGAAKFSGVATAKSLSVVSTNGYSGQIIQQGDIFGTSATNLLIQSSTSNGIGFLVNGGTTFNMFINSTGNVGIGTTTPNSFGGGYRTLAIAGTGTEGGMIQSMVGSTSALFIGTNSSQCFFAEPRNVFMTFSTNDTERMRITAEGNLGFGMTPYNNGLSKAIDLVGGGGMFGFNNNFYLSGNGYFTDSWRYKTTGSIAIIEMASSGIITFATSSSGSANAVASPTEKMRITSGGQVGVATTTISSAFNMQVGNNAGVIATTVLRLQNSYLEGTTGYYGAQITAVDNGVDGHNLQFQTRANASSGFSTRMTITTTGNIGAPSGTNIYNASDIRLKQNISKTTYGLDTISALNPVKFNWVDGFEPSEDGKDMLGFVAQEVQQVIPEAVELFGGDINLNGEIITTPLRVNEKFIIPVLVKAIQELKTEIDTLKNK